MYPLYHNIFGFLFISLHKNDFIVFSFIFISKPRYEVITMITIYYQLLSPTFTLFLLYWLSTDHHLVDHDHITCFDDPSFFKAITWCNINIFKSIFDTSLFFPLWFFTFCVHGIFVTKYKFDSISCWVNDVKSACIGIHTRFMYIGYTGTQARLSENFFAIFTSELKM